MNLSYNVETLLKQRYYKPGEDWPALVHRVVNGVCISNKDDVHSDLINRVWLPNSPCLVNAGTRSGGLMACFVVGPTEDTIENHGETLKDIAVVGKRGGGCGFTANFIRPEGSIVDGSAHESGTGIAYGPNQWALRVSDYLDMITQGGYRKMALMYSMSSEHDDLDKFINLKQFQTEKFGYNFNQSVFASDDWMFGNTEKSRRQLATLAENAWRNGEPGLLFADTINRDTPYGHGPCDCVIHTTNPCGEQPLPPYGSCIGGGELIASENGIRMISQVPHDDLTVSSTGKRTIVDRFFWLDQGEKSTVRVTLEGGMRIETTPDHIFMTDVGQVRAGSLIERGASVYWMDNNPLVPSIGSESPTTREERIAFAIGWMHGDGWLTEGSIGISFNKEDGDFEVKNSVLKIWHKLFGSRKPLKDNDASYQEQTNSAKARRMGEKYGFYLSKSPGRKIPQWFYEASIYAQLFFLQALFTADGWVLGKASSQIGYSTNSPALAVELQKILGILGIQSTQYVTRFETGRNPQYRLVITKESARKFMGIIGFATSKKRSKFNWSAKEYKDSNYLSVAKVEPCGEQKVYDLSMLGNAPVFFVNGILVHNCNLASINVAHDELYNAKGDFNYSALWEKIETMTRFLDDLGTRNVFPNSKFAHWYAAHRPIGIGIMGFADGLLRQGIAYGSTRSILWLEAIMADIQMASHDTSELLAEERGIPSHCQTRRNITTTSIAPTGSIGFIAECSHGIEPIFSPRFKRRDERGEEYIFENEYASEDFFRSSMNDDPSKMPSYSDHIYIQAAAQTYCDSAVSKTINFVNGSTPDDIAKAMVLAWDNGCKGITVYRDGSRDTQVLESLVEEDSLIIDCPAGVCDL
jgi:ribonucleoside-diphosphate reductase alpha chain